MNPPDGLPPGWECPRLAEIAQINPPLDRCVISDDVSVNFVPMRAVEAEGGGLLRPEERAYGDVKKGFTSFLSGDVIMAKITPCMENGKTTVVPELPGSVCFGSTEFHVLRPEQRIEPRLIANFLLQHDTRRAAQRAMTGGVGQMRVPASFLEALRIPLPPPHEQVRVAEALDELLSDLDVGVAALEQTRAKLTLYRAAVLKAAVEGTLTSEWRQRHPDTEPATELLGRILVERRHRWEERQLRSFEEKGQAPAKNWIEKYKEPLPPDDGDLPGLPPGWRWTTIDQIAVDVRNGHSAKPDAIGSVPILRISAVRPLKLDLDDLRYLSGDPSDYAASLIQERDLLFTRYNGTRTFVGVCAVVPSLERKFVHPDKLIRARPLPSVPVPAFLALAANVGASRRFLDGRIRTTAGQAGVSGGDIKELPVPLPPASEQLAIIEAVEDTLSIIEHIESEIDDKAAKAHALRQSILRQAFTGRLVPQDPNDEPASELLKRIAAERDTCAQQAATKRAVRTPKKKTPKVP